MFRSDYITIPVADTEEQGVEEGQKEQFGEHIYAFFGTGRGVLPRAEKARSMPIEGPTIAATFSHMLLTFSNDIQTFLAPFG